ncbi:MAG: hypothetical protein HYY10_03340 [Candidatus Liptonbacteria bacterium]|nr:hypothetical protein [Candidatus Liptonbacteria bacterium]
MSRRNTPPTLDVSWEPNPPKLEAATGCYSTTLHVNVGGDWQGGFPQTVGLTVFTGGRRVDELSKPVDILNRHGEYPLTGLEVGRDYSIHVDAGSKQKNCLLSVREPEKESKADKKLRKLRGEKEVAETTLALNEAQAKTSTAATLRANQLALADRQLRLGIAEAEGKVAKAQHDAKALTPKHTPVKLTVSAGRNGDDKYDITIFVADEHGKGIPHHPLVVRDGETIVTPAPTTDDNGMKWYTTPKPFANNDDSPRWIEVSAGVGKDLNWGQEFYRPTL